MSQSNPFEPPVSADAPPRGEGRPTPSGASKLMGIGFVFVPTYATYFAARVIRVLEEGRSAEMMVVEGWTRIAVGPVVALLLAVLPARLILGAGAVATLVSVGLIVGEADPSLVSAMASGASARMLTVGAVGLLVAHMIDRPASRQLGSLWLFSIAFSVGGFCGPLLSRVPTPAVLIALPLVTLLALLGLRAPDPRPFERARPTAWWWPALMVVGAVGLTAGPGPAEGVDSTLHLVLDVVFLWGFVPFGLGLWLILGPPRERALTAALGAGALLALGAGLLSFLPMPGTASLLADVAETLLWPTLLVIARARGLSAFALAYAGSQGARALVQIPGNDLVASAPARVLFVLMVAAGFALWLRQPDAAKA